GPVQGGTPLAGRHQCWRQAAFERLSFAAGPSQGKSVHFGAASRSCGGGPFYEPGDNMKFADSEFDPYVLAPPTSSAIPLVCDSAYFQYCIPVSDVRSAEDSYVDELWQAIPSVGGSLLAANFPRSYIDPNREVDDIDPNILAEPWTTALHPTEKSRLGHGLI